MFFSAYVKITIFAKKVKAESSSHLSVCLWGEAMRSQEIAQQHTIYLIFVQIDCPWVDLGADPAKDKVTLPISLTIS
jgi:hypothetical protein